MRFHTHGETDSGALNSNSSCKRGDNPSQKHIHHVNFGKK